ncbi:gas vesicle protein [Streptomyces sp. NPDC058751]|uniref:gas vesicle protein GvpO n=1 Tax=Streptomyces sp. NPDC058751 TaxID=3346623 RepID=UPI0036B6D3C1
MAAAEPAKRRPSAGRGTARRSAGDSASPSRPKGPARAIHSAVEQLGLLLGRAPEAVSAIRPKDDGWEADVEVLELERIPETTSVMATYRVTLDGEGDLMAYERKRRYTRGQIDRR